KQALLLVTFVFTTVLANAQTIKWSPDGNSYYQLEGNEVIQYTLPANTKSTFISRSDLTPKGQTAPLTVRHFFLSADQQKVLIYTNSKRVWRLDSRGDYWVLEMKSKSLR